MNRTHRSIVAGAILAGLGLTVASVLAPTASADDEEVLINWKFQAGEVRGFRSLADIRIETTPKGGGEAETYHQRRTLTGHYKVLEVDAKGMTLNRVEHKDVTYDLTQGGQRYGWDSSADWAKEHAKAESLRSLVDLIREYRQFNVDTVGAKVSNMRFEEAPEGVARFPYTKPVSDAERNAKDKLDRFTQITQAAFDSYAKRKVRPGDTWKVTAPRRVGPGVLTDITTTYTLLDVVPYRGARCARLEAKLTFELQSKGKLVTAEGKGEMYWDLDGGYLTSSWIDEKITVEVDQPGKGAVTMEIINRQEFRCESGEDIPE